MRALITAFLGLMIIPAGVRAQGFAPDSITATYLTVSVSGGSAPFVGSGSYRLFTSVAGTNYVVLGRAGAGFASGTYGYVKTGPNSGVLTFLDSQSGPGNSMAISFSSSAAGTLVLTGATGSQSGSFTTTNYATANQPGLFLPNLGNGRFQSYLGGQNGFVYSIETSSDLASWLPLTSTAISDLTTNLNVSAGAKAGFFRARVQATDFAPNSLTNKTFNFAITDGLSPLPTNGIYQWLADANDNGYQIIGGPGTTNSAGTYSYVKTGPSSGTIACTDSKAGNLNEALVFTSPDSGYFYATNSSGIENGNFSLAEGPVEFLGNISFVPDTAHSGQLFFAADGTPASLSVTNAAGWVWMLNFPGDALPNPAQITMTPFAIADSSDALLPVTNGVQLEPDGIQFSDAVTLTVNPPAPLGSYASLLLAGDDGSGLYLVPTTGQGGGYSTTLFHFTSAGATDPSIQAWTEFLQKHPASQAQAVYNQASNTVITMDSAAIPVLPAPPDYRPAPCLVTNPADGDVDTYIKTVLTKQTAVLKNLFDSAAMLNLMGTNLFKQSTNLARGLIETNEFPLVDELIARYAPGNVEKFQAVYKFAANISAQDKLYGGKGNTNWNNELKPWAEFIVANDLAQLRGHDYTMIKAAQSAFSTMEKDFGTNIQEQADFASELRDAMTFKFSMDLTFDEQGGSASSHIEAGSSVVGGVITMAPLGTNVSFPLYGTGTIPYTSGQFGGGAAQLIASGSSFSEDVLVTGFDGCSLTAKIMLDNPSAVYTDATPGDTANITEVWNFANVLTQTWGTGTPYGALLASAYDPSGYNPAGGHYGTVTNGFTVNNVTLPYPIPVYSFPVAIQNGNAQAVNQSFVQTFTVQGGSGSATITATFNLTLTHTPQ